MITKPNLTGDNEHPRFFHEWLEARKWCAENLPNDLLDVHWCDVVPVDGNTEPVTYRTGESGESIEEWWDADGKLHRDRMPAQIITFASDGWTERSWYQHGLCHRKDSPARIIIRAGGASTKQWYRSDKLHRIDGPAIIDRDTTGTIVGEEWWIDGSHIEGSPIER